MTLDPAEAIYVLTVTWVRHHEHQVDHERLARWLADEHSLDVIEAAAGLAFDPPRGPVEMRPLAVLLDARWLARHKVPASPEGAYPLGEVGDDPLSRAVEDVFETFTDP